MKALLVRAFALARRRHHLAASTRRQHRQRLERDLDAVIALAPTQRDGRRLRKRYPPPDRMTLDIAATATCRGHRDASFSQVSCGARDLVLA